MLKKTAFIIAVVLIISGVFFVGLDILDIAEDFRLHLPIAVLNTIFITGVGLLAAGVAAMRFTNTDCPEMLGLGGAVLAFGVGILIYGWFTRAVLDVRMTVYDSAFLIAAVAHFCGAALFKLKPVMSGLRARQKQAIVVVSYLIIFAIIAVIAWLIYAGVLPTLAVSRDIMHGVAAVLCLITTVIYYRIYVKAGSVFYYWYSLGLVLVAFGVLFISQGALESRVAWLGRLAQYAGGIYFLAAVFGAHRRVIIRDDK